MAKLDALTAHTARARAELSRVVALGGSAQATLGLMERLDQAILAKAFRSELVSQDPADESASALLARIKADRGDTAGAGHGRKRRAAA